MYFYTTYGNKICVMKYGLNVDTNYICVNFKSKKMKALIFYLIPSIYQGNIKNTNHK